MSQVNDGRNRLFALTLVLRRTVLESTTLREYNSGTLESADLKSTVLVF
jgi:hypothetical protein